MEDPAIASTSSEIENASRPTVRFASARRSGCVQARDEDSRVWSACGSSPARLGHHPRQVSAHVRSVSTVSIDENEGTAAVQQPPRRVRTHGCPPCLARCAPALPRPPHPRPASREDREAPRAGMMSVCYKYEIRKRTIFFRRGLDEVFCPTPRERLPRSPHVIPGRPERASPESIVRRHARPEGFPGLRARACIPE